MKRYRIPKAKDGELKMVYGIADRREPPDIVFAWGDGCSKRDGALLHYLLASKRVELIYGDEAIQLNSKFKFANSLIEELESRGYDITTIKFSIQKKKESQMNLGMKTKGEME